MTAHTSAAVDPKLIDSAFDGDFEQLLESNFAIKQDMKGQVVKGLIVEITRDEVIVDIGMKAEGRIAKKEFFYSDGDDVDLKVGDQVDVFVDTLDGPNGQTLLSREKARREEVLDNLQTAYDKNEPVNGIIFGKVKGGFAVDVTGILAFMPGSQVDSRPLKDVDHLMHRELELQILKLDRNRGNLIVSRRALQDQSRSADRDEVLEGMSEGKVLEGIVKNITDYGAFVDLGGVDGLLHITDIAWNRINHPSEALKVGQTIQVKVIRFDEESKRISLGMKQLQDDPWESVENEFTVGSKVTGKVTSLTDYGAFIELGAGVEGLIHMSELSWTRKNVHPNKILSDGQEVEVLVLEIDREKRRISLGYKQCQENPWEAFAKKFTEGDKVKGTVRSTTEFGLFVGLEDDIDGLIHVSDISWEKEGEEAMADFKKGDGVEAVILALEPAKERVALGLKQLSGDPLGNFMEAHKRGDVIKAKVIAVKSEGIEVELAENVTSFIKSRDLSTERAEQDPTRYSEGDETDVKITQLLKKDRKLSVSIRALQVAEEKEAIKEYANTEEGGATLGDVLSQAVKKDDK